MGQEYRALTSALKQVLRGRKITYSVIAAKLCTSEQTIKRLFTQDDGAVGRLVQICDIVDLSFNDLVDMALNKGEDVFTLPEALELAFVEEPHLYACFDAVLNGETEESICQRFHLSKESWFTVIRGLEKIGVLERLPEDRIKLLYKGTHNWRPGGPLFRHFGVKESMNFIREFEEIGTFSSEEHFYTSSNRHASKKTISELVANLRALFADYRRRVQHDEKSLPADDLIPITWVAALARQTPPFERHLDEWRARR